MTNEDSKTTDGMNRRRILKGTAVAGFAGTALTGTASATERKTLTVKGTGEVAEYRFTVSGEIVETGGNPGGEDRVVNNGQTAVGKVGGFGTDTFEFTGQIESFEFVQGDAKVFVNGELVTFDGDLSNKITIKAKGERVAYKFRVTGDVAKAPEAGILGVDTIEGNVVRGEVGGSIQGNPDPVDVYRYSGAITFFEEDGPLEVILDINP